MAQKNKELGQRNLSLPAKVVIIVFAVMMALSMTLPSLASIFASRNASSSSQAEETDESEATTDEPAETTDEASGESTDESAEAEAEEKKTDPAVPDNEQLQSLSETYAPKVARYEEKLAEDKDNLAALLNLGQTYMNWGYSATSSSSTEEETAYSQGLLDQAVSYFDQYLSLNDAKTVRVDRALCLSYAGKSDEAIADLTALTEQESDYALAWANLGMLLENAGKTDEASEAYRKAAEYDPDDEFGAKSYANKRLIALNSSVSSPGDAGDASADSISTDSRSGLTSTLANDSGVGF